MERCQGSGCTAFAQIASVADTTYSDTSLAAATSYSYRVRATDAAGNLSGYSTTATTTTLAADTTPPTVPASLTATTAAQATSSPSGGSVLDASNFNDLPENPLSEGGKWAALLSLSPNGGRMQKSGGMAFSTLLSPDHSGARTTTPMPADQYSEIVVGAVDAIQGNVGPIVRVQTGVGTLDSHYLWWVGAANQALYRVDANGSAYAASLLAVVTTAAVPGDTCRLIARGGSIYGTINGTRVVFAWDTTYASGQTGILAFPGTATTTSRIDSWNAGDQPALSAGSGSGVWDSSTFAGANETQQSGIDEGGRWYPSDITATVGVVWRVSNAAIGSRNGNHNIAGNWNITPPNNQYSQVTLGTVTGGGGGPMVRMSRGAHTGYLLFIFPEAPSASGIYQWTGSDNFTLLQSFTPSRIQTGDTWGLYANGTSLDVKLNGVSVGAPFPITDATYASGDVGFDLFSNAMTVTAWEGGDIHGLNQVNLAWTASTDDVGVSGYLVERCQGSGCTAFAQVASVAGTAYWRCGSCAGHQLQLPGPGDGCRRQPQRLLEHRDRHDPCSAGHHPADAALGPDRDSGEPEPDQSRLDGRDRHRRRHGLPGGTLSGQRVHDLRPGRQRDDDHLQQYGSRRGHQLQLPGPGDGCRRQPQRLLEYRDGHDPCSAGHHPADAALGPDRDGGEPEPGQSGVDRRDRHRRRDRLPGGTLPGQRVHDLRPGRQRGGHRL